jgi:hypothetical protein
MSTARPLVRSPAAWLLLAVLAAEFLAFDQIGARRYTAIYPRWNDQIQYLGEAYSGHEYARRHGLAAALGHTLANPSAQGTLHDTAAVLVFAVAGPSRSAALALNLLALLAWQAALFAGVAHVSRSRALAFAAALLPAALAGPWSDVPGSAYDFRLDHLALCALGVASALALRTDGFRARGAALVFGAAVGVTLLTRFLTGTYFVVIAAALLAGILRGGDRGRRAGNLGLAVLVAFALAAPIFWLNREWVWNYYYIGHYVGPESAIRNQHFGLGASLAFLWSQLSGRHLGGFFLGLAVATPLLLAVWRGRPGPGTARAVWWLGAVFLLAPALVLTLHQQKSEVVVGALAPGAVLLVVAAWLSLAGGAEDRARLRIFAGLVTLATLAFFVRSQFLPRPDPAFLAGNRQVLALADTLCDRARAAGIERPAVAVDYITDSLDAQDIRIIGYERKRGWIPFEMTLPTGIAAPEEADVFARLALSHFVFVTEEAPAGGFPYDTTLAALRPRVRAWCEEHLRPAEQFTLFGRRMILYQRREIPFP